MVYYPNPSFGAPKGSKVRLNYRVIFSLADLVSVSGCEQLVH